MSKIKFTKGELKKQRDNLKRFERFLPILVVKKQQIQYEIQNVHKKLSLKVEEIDSLEGEINEWANLLEEGIEYVNKFAKPSKIVLGSLNIAGVDIPLFEKAEFDVPEYDLFLAPLWVDKAIESIRCFVVLLEEEKILKRQSELLSEELRITTQRVNLFEKIKIPESRENIRRIRIYLGDQETNAVGRSKIAKRKVALQEVLV